MMPSPRSLLHLVAHILPLVSLASSLHIKDRVQQRNETVPTTYYGVSSAEHEAKSSALKASGHRPLSLSLYGSPPEVKYAAVWVQEEGGAFETIQTGDKASFETIQTGDKASFDSWIQGWKAKGYVSTHVSATGSGDNAAYAGVMQQMDVANWMQECDLTSPYAFENATGGIDMLIKGVSMYGSSTSPLYCVLGHENIGNQQQTSFYSSATYKYNYAEVYAAETLKRYWRPTFIDVAGDGTLTPLFDDTSVGEWVAEVDLSESQLSSKIAEHAANGLSPIHLQGGGDSSSSPRYAAIFAERSAPFPRRWTASGSVTGFEDNAAVTTALDTTMRAYMTTNGVRQAQVAASINGTLIASRAYTWAEPDRATVTTTHQFLLASLSKMFTHAATQVLIDEGYLNTSTPIYPLLGLHPTDPRANAITVNDLLSHSAGYDRTVSPDLGFVFTQVAQANNASAPATLRDVIDWVLARPLDYAPGTRTQYSNFGTMLLSYAIEQLTETPYLDFLKAKVLDADMAVDLYATASAKHTNDPIVQETKYTSISALTPLDETHKAPAVYGGDGAVKEEAVGAFGLKASAETIARFIGTHAVWGIGPRQTWYTRDGSLAGARAFAESQTELDWALTLNTREYVSEIGWNELTLTDLGSSVFMKHKTL